MHTQYVRKPRKHKRAVAGPVGGSAGWVVFLGVVAVGVVYFAFLGGAQRWPVKNIVGWFSQDASDTPSGSPTPSLGDEAETPPFLEESATPALAATERIEGSVMADGFAIYVLQRGAFKTLGSANQAKAELQEKNVACAVLQDGSLFRVVEQAHFEEGQARASKEARPEDEQKDIYVTKVSVAAVNLRVVATQEQCESIQNLTDGWIATAKAIDSLQNDLTANKQNMAAAKAELERIWAGMEAKLAFVESLIGAKNQPEILKKLCVSIKQSKANFEKLSQDTLKTELVFLGELRYNLVEMVSAMNAYAVAINGDDATNTVAEPSPSVV